MPGSFWGCASLRKACSKGELGFVSVAAACLSCRGCVEIPGEVLHPRKPIFPLNSSLNAPLIFGARQEEACWGRLSDVGHPFVRMHGLLEQVRSCRAEGFGVKLSLTWWWWWWWHLLSLGREPGLGFAPCRVTGVPHLTCEARGAWGGKVTLFFVEGVGLDDPYGSLPT